MLGLNSTPMMQVPSGANVEPQRRGTCRYCKIVATMYLGIGRRSSDFLQYLLEGIAAAIMSTDFHFHLYESAQAECTLSTARNQFRRVDSDRRYKCDRSLQNKTPQTQFESWDVCRSALPQVLLNHRLTLPWIVVNGSAVPLLKA
jgi:hypothetical protein